ncbi:MAG: hypothetical protein U1A72_07645, partial [Sulfuritalea sp.]|nr:hypothetical protein [Sulfuritalea sp.]
PALLPGLLATLQTEQGALDAVLARVAATPVDAGGFAADPERAQAVLAQLEPLLASDDTAAGELFAAHRALLLASFGAEAMQLERQLAAFDFPQALGTARSMILPAAKH